jgi:hypothetical protein
VVPSGFGAASGSEMPSSARLTRLPSTPRMLMPVLPGYPTLPPPLAAAGTLISGE